MTTLDEIMRGWTDREWDLFRVYKNNREYAEEKTSESVAESDRTAAFLAARAFTDKMIKTVETEDNVVSSWFESWDIMMGAVDGVLMKDQILSDTYETLTKMVQGLTDFEF